MLHSLIGMDMPSPHRSVVARGEELSVGTFGLKGMLITPPGARGLVIFAHGSGSSRHSPRNSKVAAFLHDAGLGTLLFDLLTEEETANQRNAFDIGLLAERLVDATDWAQKNPQISDLPIGYFGASTGAAAALVAASIVGPGVGAVVSRGGRPDLAGDALERVVSPTLLIVGANDLEVLALNRAASCRLKCEKSLAIVARATHLFEESGTLEEVMQLTRIWYTMHLRRSHAGNWR